MNEARHRWRVGRWLAACLLLAPAIRCDLNPQPLPPVPSANLSAGGDAGPAEGEYGDASAGGAAGSTSSGGGGRPADAGSAPISNEDAGATVEGEAGGVAEEDASAPGDAGLDGVVSAPDSGAEPDTTEPPTDGSPGSDRTE